jgi:hypothetical protein
MGGNRLAGAPDGAGSEEGKLEAGSPAVAFLLVDDESLASQSPAGIS